MGICLSRVVTASKQHPITVGNYTRWIEKYLKEDDWNDLCRFLATETNDTSWQTASRYDLTRSLIRGDASLLQALQSYPHTPKNILRLHWDSATQALEPGMHTFKLTADECKNAIPGRSATELTAQVMENGALNVAVHFNQQAGWAARYLPGKQVSHVLGWIGDSEWPPLVERAKRIYSEEMGVDLRLGKNSKSLSHFFAREEETKAVFLANRAASQARGEKVQVDSPVHAHLTQVALGWDPNKPVFDVRRGSVSGSHKLAGVASVNDLLGLVSPVEGTMLAISSKKKPILHVLHNQKEPLVPLTKPCAVEVFNLDPSQLHAAIHSGKLVSIKRISGTTYHSVGDAIIRENPDLLATNPRTIFTFMKDGYEYYVVFVDAKGVARLKVSEKIKNKIGAQQEIIEGEFHHVFPEHLDIEEGESLGYYAFGAGFDARDFPSTVVIVKPMDMIGDEAAQRNYLEKMLPMVNQVVVPGQPLVW